MKLTKELINLSSKDMMENASNNAPDKSNAGKLLALLRTGYGKAIGHIGSDHITPESRARIHDMYRHFRDSLMADDIAGFFHAYEHHSAKHTDDFDFLMDEVFSAAGVDNIDELLVKAGVNQAVNEANGHYEPLDIAAINKRLIRQGGLIKNITGAVNVHTDGNKTLIQGAVKESYDDDEDEDDSDANEFFVIVYNKDEKSYFVGQVLRGDGGAWRERTFKGEPEYGWGQRYMSYVSVDDIMTTIKSQYEDDYYIVRGPFYTSRDALATAEARWGSIKESADYAKQLIRGEKSGPGLLNRLNKWLFDVLVGREKDHFINASQAQKQLSLAGFSKDQIDLIRDVAIRSAMAAVSQIQRKHGKELVPDKYISKLSDNFAVYTLFLNVDSNIRDEFYELTQKLFDKKLEKIANKLDIVKESADYSINESAQLAAKIARGEASAPGLKNKLSTALFKVLVDKDEGQFMPTDKVTKQLHRAGFSLDQIHLIRDAATKAAHAAIETIHSRYGEQKVPRSYISTFVHNFGTYTLHSLVNDEIRHEFFELTQQLFDKKLQKIESKLTLKEDTCTVNGKIVVITERYDNDADTLAEGMSMTQALMRDMSRPTGGSKLDLKIKKHNSNVKYGKEPLFTTPPSGFRFKKDGTLVLEDINEEVLTEGLRLMKVVAKDKRKAKIYKDTEWDEYRVMFYDDDEYVGHEADYLTDDRQDAMDTAEAWTVKKLKEHAELARMLKHVNDKRNFRNPVRAITKKAIRDTAAFSRGTSDSFSGENFKSNAFLMNKLRNRALTATRSQRVPLSARAPVSISKDAQAYTAGKGQVKPTVGATYRKSWGSSIQDTDIAESKNSADKTSYRKAISILDKFHNLLHHIAEEELVACKVYELNTVGHASNASTYINGEPIEIEFVADCNDVPRAEGFQEDLTKKLQERLNKHPLSGIGVIKAKVVHKEKDGYVLDGTGKLEEQKQSWEEFNKWKAAVLKAYPEKAKKMRFNGRVEDNQTTVSAEIPGEDRSYGVFYARKNKGYVLGESA